MKTALCFRRLIGNMHLQRRRRPLKRSRLLAVAALSTAPAHGLHVAVLTGTSRTDGPPRPILGPRVGQFIVSQLERMDAIEQVSLLDPRELGLPLLEKPAFCYSKSQIPPQLQQIQETLQSADAYVMVTPEYNHAPSPALLNLLNHFGSTVFSYKPSAIVSYSAGQWGGTRAAIALRPILSELGCLPVSAMIHVPSAQEVLREDGSLVDNESDERWESYVDRCISQLVWWAQAAQAHRGVVDPFAASPGLVSHPSQRNAPSSSSSN